MVLKFVMSFNILVNIVWDCDEIHTHIIEENQIFFDDIYFFFRSRLQVCSLNEILMIWTDFEDDT